jgi:tyrosinase
MNGVHGGVHVRTGGDMGSVPTASYDPIFYLHHANVDRLWAQWQADHPGVALPASEATFEMPPFNRPFSTQWQRGSDVESTDALGYRYRRFCLRLPPIRLWEVAVIEWPWIVREQMRSARLVLASGQMQDQPMEIRAFLDQPRATGRTKTGGNAAFAGVVGFMGHPDVAAPAFDAAACAECARLGHTHTHAEHMHGGTVDRPAVGPAERFDVALDITAAARALDRDVDEVALKLVAVGADGDPVEAADIRLDGIELVVD